MATILLLTMLVVSACDQSTQTKAENTSWRSDYAQAQAESQQSGKAILLYFTADWCVPCQRMKREVFSQPEVWQAMDRLTLPVKVDLTDPSEMEQDLAGQFGIQAIPTMILVNQEGRELGRQVGGVNTSQFLGWLETAKPASPAP